MVLCCLSRSRRLSFSKNMQKKVLASAVSTDGRKEWTCKFCSEWVCGQGGVAGAAIMTSQQVRVGSTGRQLLQGMENGPRAPQCRVERKTGGTKAWRQRIRSFKPGVRPWKRRKVKESKEGKGFHQRESDLEEEWGVEMDLEDEAESRKMLDEQKRKFLKELRDVESSRVCTQ